MSTLASLLEAIREPDLSAFERCRQIYDASERLRND